MIRDSMLDRMILVVNFSAPPKPLFPTEGFQPYLLHARIDCSLEHRSGTTVIEPACISNHFPTQVKHPSQIYASQGDFISATRYASGGIDERRSSEV